MKGITRFRLEDVLAGRQPPLPPRPPGAGPADRPAPLRPRLLPPAEPQPRAELRGADHPARRLARRPRQVLGTLLRSLLTSSFHHSLISPLHKILSPFSSILTSPLRRLPLFSRCPFTNEAHLYRGQEPADGRPPLFPGSDLHRAPGLTVRQTHSDYGLHHPPPQAAVVH